MILVMFDIDGTLTESSDLDSAAYLRALGDVFGFGSVSADWDSYTHVTDSGILKEICRTRRGDDPTLDELARFRARLLELLAEGASARGGIRPVPGAPEVLSRLLASREYAVAYASGAWADSAFFKLRSAGLPTKGIPSCFADDDYSREGICTLARCRAESRYRSPFERVVYVGDGAWDVRTALKLGYSFIGVGRALGAAGTGAQGNIGLLPDYEDTERFFLFLQQGKKDDTPPGFDDE